MSHSVIPSLKKDLASHIRDTILAKRLNQTEAAKLAKTNRVRIAKICHGNFQDFSADSLLKILVHLGHEIILEVRPIPPAKKIRLVSHGGKN